MFGQKVYGQSKVSTCPFCGAQAFSKNSQDVPVCKSHTGELLPDFKCACGEWLDLRIGKWGPFFTCFHCGVVTLRKALDIYGGPLLGKKESQESRKEQEKEKSARSKTTDAHAADARKFEELARKLKETEGIPTLDEIAKDW